MASSDFNAKTGRARLFFRYGGRQFNKTIKVGSGREAERACALIEETIQDLERGKRDMPDGADPAVFILSGGKVSGKPRVSDPFQEEPASATLGQVFEIYTATLTPGSKEANSIETETIHTGHFSRVLGDDKVFDTLDVGAIQAYVDERAGDEIARQTIKKELSTLRVIWGWAHKRGHIRSALEWRVKDLTLPKAQERPPFATWDQITRRIERGGLSEEAQADLWECLWLDQSQTVQCLKWVRKHAPHPFAYPLFAFAAYTGARRGEMLRSERDDWDFEGGTVTLRQKKADTSRDFTRRAVPIHPALAKTMKAWLSRHPRGPWTIATEDGNPIGPRMATKYFRAALRGGKWSVLHGWHVFRHSLASNMASAGVDQRVINEVLGHHTEEMERRYRHLLPQKQEHALHSLFR